MIPLAYSLTTEPNMPVQKMTKCPVCHGAGRTPAGKVCRRCKGSGEINALRKDKPGNFRPGPQPHHDSAA
jgi:DnaJ-class molecular chaperone